MQSIDVLREKLAFDLWANRRLAEALHVPDAPPRAVELFGHVLWAHELWADRIEGKSIVVDPRVDHESFDAMIESAHGRLDAVLRSEDEDSLDRRIEYRDLAGNRFATPLRDILIHVFLHGAHHRAQIVTALKETGHAGPRVDYILYWRDKEEA